MNPLEQRAATSMQEHVLDIRMRTSVIGNKKCCYSLADLPTAARVMLAAHIGERVWPCMYTCWYLTIDNRECAHVSDDIFALVDACTMYAHVDMFSIC